MEQWLHKITNIAGDVLVASAVMLEDTLHVTILVATSFYAVARSILVCIEVQEKLAKRKKKCYNKDEEKENKE